MQAQGSPLVQGTAPGAQAQQRVRVLRAFWLHSQRQEVGAVITVPIGMAQELKLLQGSGLPKPPSAALFAREHSVPSPPGGSERVIAVTPSKWRLTERGKLSVFKRGFRG